MQNKRENGKKLNEIGIQMRFLRAVGGTFSSDRTAPLKTVVGTLRKGTRGRIIGVDYCNITRRIFLYFASYLQNCTDQRIWFWAGPHMKMHSWKCRKQRCERNFSIIFSQKYLYSFLKESLAGWNIPKTYRSVRMEQCLKSIAISTVQKIKIFKSVEHWSLVHALKYNGRRREEGKNWPHNQLSLVLCSGIRNGIIARSSPSIMVELGLTQATWNEIVTQLFSLPLPSTSIGSIDEVLVEDFNELWTSRLLLFFSPFHWNLKKVLNYS